MATEAEGVELQIHRDLEAYALDTTPQIIARELLAVAALLRLGWCQFINATNAEDEPVEIDDPSRVNLDLNAALAVITGSVVDREKLPDSVGPLPHTTALIKVALSDEIITESYHYQSLRATRREIQEAKDALAYAIRDNRVDEIEELQREYHRQKLNALETINDSASDFSKLEKLIERAADALTTE